MIRFLIPILSLCVFQLSAQSGGFRQAARYPTNQDIADGVRFFENTVTGTKYMVQKGIGIGWDSTRLEDYSSKPTVISLPVNQTNNTVALADVTGASFQATANSMYQIDLYLMFKSTALTTGITLNMASTGAGTTVGSWLGNIAATTANALGANFIMGANFTTPSVTPVNTNLSIRMNGIYTCSTSGTVNLKFASEVAASTVTITGGYLVITKI